MRVKGKSWAEPSQIGLYIVWNMELWGQDLFATPIEKNIMAGRGEEEYPYRAVPHWDARSMPNGPKTTLYCL